MEILARATDWTHVDEERWAAFLDSETGRRLIPKLVENSPPLLPGGESNAILIRSGEVRAFQQMIDSLYTLAHPPRPMPEPEPAYPPPEDDRYWKDGERIASPAEDKPQQPQS